MADDEKEYTRRFVEQVYETTLSDEGPAAGSKGARLEELVARADTEGWTAQQREAAIAALLDER